MPAFLCDILEIPQKTFNCYHENLLRSTKNANHKVTEAPLTGVHCRTKEGLKPHFFFRSRNTKHFRTCVGGFKPWKNYRLFELGN